MIELPSDLATELRVALLREGKRRTLRRLARDAGIPWETFRDVVTGRRPKAWRKSEVLRVVLPFLPASMRVEIERQMAPKKIVGSAASRRGMAAPRQGRGKS